MTPHPHAEFLRAIADGVPLSEFETSKNEVYWEHIGHLKLSDFFTYDRYIRRKPQHIMVNGFKVPKPLDVIPKDVEAYFVPAFDCEHLYQKDSWTDHAIDNRLFDRRLCHATKEAAIAHAKAMLGIDPEYFK